MRNDTHSIIKAICLLVLLTLLCVLYQIAQRPISIHNPIQNNLPSSSSSSSSSSIDFSTLIQPFKPKTIEGFKCSSSSTEKINKMNHKLIYDLLLSFESSFGYKYYANIVDYRHKEKLNQESNKKKNIFWFNNLLTTEKILHIPYYFLDTLNVVDTYMDYTRHIYHNTYVIDELKVLYYNSPEHRIELQQLIPCYDNTKNKLPLPKYLTYNFSFDIAFHNVTNYPNRTGYRPFNYNTIYDSKLKLQFGEDEDKEVIRNFVKPILGSTNLRKYVLGVGIKPLHAFMRDQFYRFYSEEPNPMRYHNGEQHDTRLNQRFRAFEILFTLGYLSINHLIDESEIVTSITHNYWYNKTRKSTKIYVIVKNGTTKLIDKPFTSFILHVKFKSLYSDKHTAYINKLKNIVNPLDRAKFIEKNIHHLINNSHLYHYIKRKNIKWISDKTKYIENLTKNNIFDRVSDAGFFNNIDKTKIVKYVEEYIKKYDEYEAISLIEWYRRIKIERSQYLMSKAIFEPMFDEYLQNQRSIRNFTNSCVDLIKLLNDSRDMYNTDQSSVGTKAQNVHTSTASMQLFKGISDVVNQDEPVCHTTDTLDKLLQKDDMQQLLKNFENSEKEGERDKIDVFLESSFSSEDNVKNKQIIEDILKYFQKKSSPENVFNDMAETVEFSRESSEDPIKINGITKDVFTKLWRKYEHTIYVDLVGVGFQVYLSELANQMLKNRRNSLVGDVKSLTRTARSAYELEESLDMGEMYY